MGNYPIHFILPPQPPVRIGSDFQLVFEIKNDNDFPFEKGLHITLKESKYYLRADLDLPRNVPAFSVSDRITMIIRVKNAHVLASEIPTFLEFMVPKINKDPFLVPNNINRFKQNLYDNPPNKNLPFNFLVYGKNGVGKSSFINTCYTLIQERLSYQVAVGRAGDHITQCLFKYPLTGTNINLWDTWGVNAANYKDNELTNFLNGVLPPGWKMEENKANAVEVIEQLEATKHTRQIHAILILIAATNLTNPVENSFHEKLKQDILTVQHLGYNPLLILNRTDEAIPSFDVAMLNDVNNPPPRINELKKQAAETFNIDKSQVFCQVNYFNQEKTISNIDRMTLAILEKAMNVAKDLVFKLDIH